MSLKRILDDLVEHLHTEVDYALTTIGGEEVTQTSELPAIILSIESAQFQSDGIGGPRSSFEEGALQLDVLLDLEHPSLEFPGESVSLLDDDRRGLQLPHSPLVTQDGIFALTLSASDISLNVDATPWTLVASSPTGTQFTVSPIDGKLSLGSALPATGSVTMQYYIGQWELRRQKVAGRLVMALVEDDGESLDALTQAVYDALDPSVLATTLPALLRLEPSSLGPMFDPTKPGGNSRRRALQFQFLYELQDRIISTGGGRIRRIPLHTHLRKANGDIAASESEVRTGDPSS